MMAGVHVAADGRERERVVRVRVARIQVNTSVRALREVWTRRITLYRKGDSNEREKREIPSHL